jgi:hypothetical protein
VGVSPGLLIPPRRRSARTLTSARAKLGGSERGSRARGNMRWLLNRWCCVSRANARAKLTHCFSAPVLFVHTRGPGGECGQRCWLCDSVSRRITQSTVSTLSAPPCGCSSCDLASWLLLHHQHNKRLARPPPPSTPAPSSQCHFWPAISGPVFCVAAPIIEYKVPGEAAAATELVRARAC